jgi:hypothetical protein
MARRYNLKNIRALLTEGFTAEELRTFCQDELAFRPVYNQLAEGMGTAKIIALLLEHTEQKLLFDPLLAWAEEHNPARYAQHQPYFEATTDPAIPPQFQTIIDNWTKNFVGREYVFAAIDSFLSNQSKGYFIIEGDPGIGKTAILAEYVRRTGCVAYFNRGTTSFEFLKSVCTQLAVRYDLSNPLLSPEATNYIDSFEELLKKVSERIEPDEKLVIAVDALDEVNLNSHPFGVNILYLPRSLPKDIYFIMTCRPRVNLPLVVDALQPPLDLMKHYDENLQDVQVYITNTLKERPQLRIWIDAQQITVEEFITTLTEKSENNFMYLHYVLQDIEKGLYRDLAIEKLPVRLEGYYGDHWQRMGMVANPLPHTKIKIVYILAEVLQPVPRRLISQFAQENEFIVQAVLDEWDQFLHKLYIDDQIYYSVYHASFRDFLHRKEIVKAYGKTIIEDTNTLITDSYLKNLFEDE